MSSHDIESENLAAHVSICQERYRALEHRIIEMEQKIDAVNTVLREIRDDIADLRNNHHTRWNSAQIGLIGVMASVIGVLLGSRLL